jgi:hypothetical protein
MSSTYMALPDNHSQLQSPRGGPYISMAYVVKDYIYTIIFTRFDYIRMIL